MPPETTSYTLKQLLYNVIIVSKVTCYEAAASRADTVPKNSHISLDSKSEKWHGDRAGGSYRPQGQ